MYKKLKHTKERVEEKDKHILTLEKLATESVNIDEFVSKGMLEFSQYTIEFYEVVGDILEEIGFKKESWESLIKFIPKEV